MGQRQSWKNAEIYGINDDERFEKKDKNFHNHTVLVEGCVRNVLIQ